MWRVSSGGFIMVSAEMFKKINKEYKRRFVEDDLLINLPDKEVDKIVRTHMTFKNMLKIVPTLGTLELFTLEDRIIKEFFRRSKL
jgi:hypothetical protein